MDVCRELNKDIRDGAGEETIRQRALDLEHGTTRSEGAAETRENEATEGGNAEGGEEGGEEETGQEEAVQGGTEEDRRAPAAVVNAAQPRPVYRAVSEGGKLTGASMEVHGVKTVVRRSDGALGAKDASVVWSVMGLQAALIARLKRQQSAAKGTPDGSDKAKDAELAKLRRENEAFRDLRRQMMAIDSVPLAAASGTSATAGPAASDPVVAPGSAVARVPPPMPAPSRERAAAVDSLLHVLTAQYAIVPVEDIRNTRGEPFTTPPDSCIATAYQRHLRSALCGAFPHAVTSMEAPSSSAALNYLVFCDRNIRLRWELRRYCRIKKEFVFDPSSSPEQEITKLVNQYLPGEDVSLIAKLCIEFSEPVDVEGGYTIVRDTSSPLYPFKKVVNNVSALVPSDVDASSVLQHYTKPFRRGVVEFTCSVAPEICTKQLVSKADKFLSGQSYRFCIQLQNFVDGKWHALPTVPFQVNRWYRNLGSTPAHFVLDSNGEAVACSTSLVPRLPVRTVSRPSYPSDRKERKGKSVTKPLKRKRATQAGDGEGDD